jgi:DNA invertase Pin-like site-specific DNA recombinase
MVGVIYARYSEGPRQTDQSIEGQVADCRAYAEQHGIQIADVYADRHISGRSVDGRDAFQQMIRDAEKRLFDCVIVWKVDRFGRSREDIAVNKMRLRRAGVVLMYARESVPDGPEGILMESLLEGLAEYYSADLRQKVVRGQRESAKKGRLPLAILLHMLADTAPALYQRGVVPLWAVELWGAVWAAAIMILAVRCYRELKERAAG